MRLAHSILVLLLLAEVSLCRAAPEPGPGLDLYGDPLPPGAVARLGRVPFRVRGTVMAAAISPDGKTAAALDYRGAEICLSLWDSGTGRLIRRRPIQDGQANTLAFLPDGKVVVAGTTGRKVWLREEAAREARYCQDDDGVAFGEICFSADGKLLAAAREHYVCLWERATGRLLRRYPSKDYLMSLAFSPDGKVLASGGRDHAIHLWEVASGRLLRQCLEGGAGMTSLAFSPDGKTLASVDYRGRLCLWQAATGKPIRQHSVVLNAIVALAFSHDSKVLAVGMERGVELYETTSGKKVSCWRGRRESVTSICFTPDDRRILAGGEGALRLWQWASGKPVHQEEGHFQDVTGLVFSPDGRVLASGGIDGTVRLWDVGANRLLCVRADHERDVTSLAFAPDSKRLVSVGNNTGEVRSWEVTPDLHLRPAWVNACAAIQVALSPDGKTVAAATTRYQGEIYLWDARSGKEERHWRGHRYGAQGLCYAPTGKALASVGGDGALRFWEAATGRPLHVYQDKGSARAGIQLCPDGRTWVWQGEALDLWDAAGGKCFRQLARGMAFAFSPDGLLLATASEFGRLELYDVPTGKEVLSWPAYEGPEVLAVAFSADGKQLASAGRDGVILLWDLELLLHGRKLPPGKLADQQMASLWQALAGDDLREAYQAVSLLAASPGQAAPFLRRRLRPVKIDMLRIERLLAELDSDAFAVRQRASRELLTFGAVIEPVLRKALAAQPTAEVQRRLEQLLVQLSRQTWTVEQMHERRCLLVLERAGTAEARHLLHELAEGAEGAWLTRAARDALQRLERFWEPDASAREW